MIQVLSVATIDYVLVKKPYILEINESLNDILDVYEYCSFIKQEGVLCKILRGI